MEMTRAHCNKLGDFLEKDFSISTPDERRAILDERKELREHLDREFTLKYFEKANK